MTIDEALRMVVPFGKYKGMYLLRLFHEQNNYFNWLRENSNGRLNEALKLIEEDSNLMKKIGFSQRRY